MFIIFLKFTGKKPNAGQFMESHNQWLKQGFDNGTFILAGSLQPNRGGAILAHNLSMNEIEAKVQADPFVVENIVDAEIFEVSPSKAIDQMKFLLG